MFAAFSLTTAGGFVAHIIVVGNEKGGSGKSTTSMHVATALARMEILSTTPGVDEGTASDSVSISSLEFLAPA